MLSSSGIPVQSSSSSHRNNNNSSMSLERKLAAAVAASRPCSRGHSSISFNCLTGGGGPSAPAYQERVPSSGFSHGQTSNEDCSTSPGSSRGGSGGGIAGKFITVREVKKRSKNSKSRTLPGRLKKRSGSPPISQNLSIFKASDSDEPWCLDVDSFNSYVLEGSPVAVRKKGCYSNRDYNNGHLNRQPSHRSCKSSSSANLTEEMSGPRSLSASVGNLIESRAKSLSRMNLARVMGRRRHASGSGSGGNNNSVLSTTPNSGSSRHLNCEKLAADSSLSGRSRSRSRSRSRLSNSVFSVSQCFGLGSTSPTSCDEGGLSADELSGVVVGAADDEDYYGRELKSDKSKGKSYFNCEQDNSDCYCASSGGTGPCRNSDHAQFRASGRSRRKFKTGKMGCSAKTGNESRSRSQQSRQNHHYNNRSSSFEFLDDFDNDEDEEYYASDTSYDKACGSEQRRSSAPLTPLLGGRETPSRFVNFFSKRSFKSNPLKRTKSVTKLERKKPIGMEPESNNVLYPSRLRTSRSHESLLAWTTNPQALNNIVNAGMMTTVDLTAGDVGVRPLHPSILGQHYAFQVITPSGSKYMSCSSAAERNAWVHAIRQAIKPHQDEIRRQENSLKIWILEAKGLNGGSGKHNKRFFCELYLDDVLYARTCAKPRGEMLFWGEHFEFSQLPNVQLITVVFFREGDKKRKKERNTCIGKVKIPVNTVNSRSLIEKWYPVVADAGSSQTLSKDNKDGPSLRIKCKFQSVDILPLRCYKTFLQYVKDEYGPVCESLENVLSVKAKEDLANAMVHVLHHEGLAKEFIAELALQEILKSGDEKLTFRGNSIATKAMEAFLKLTGSEYLHATLGPFIEQFQNAEDAHDCEIDPMKLPQASSGTLRKNQQHLRTAIDIVWKSILHSHNGMFPIELRECFVHCREALKSAGKEDLSDHLISASIFLRFLCPAILSPSLFNITNEYPSEKSARNLTLVAKVLQTLANFTRFQGKEAYMEFINDFVEKEAPNMKGFLSQISTPLSPEATRMLQKENQDKVPAGGFIDLGKYLSILSTLLGECVSKIAPKNDRFKQLQDLVENINWWLQQPANATNVSVFPFPHVTSPPPNVPPPPAPIGLQNLPVNHHQRIMSAATSPTNPLALNHQYQIPHQNINTGFPNGGSTGSSPKTPQPIYAVSGVIHNTQNPNVKNISQIQIPPLQLQIPTGTTGLVLGATTPSGNNNMNGRSGSQASSGYQSQSPVLEGSEEKGKKSSGDHYMNVQRNSNHGNRSDIRDGGENGSNSFKTNSARKCNSQSVDDLSSFGVTSNENSGFKKRLTRSSSSSDCEYSPTALPNKTSKSRSSQQKFYSPSNSQMGSVSGAKPHVKPKIVSTPHHRLNRRSSAELLRKNHPYSTSTDEDSDSCLNVSEKSDLSGAPQLPPRRGHVKRSSVGPRPNPDGSNVLSSGEEKPMDEVRYMNQRLLNASLQSADARDCTKYEKEMMELRRAMEALQMKLNRAEERLFGHDSPTSQSRRESDVFIPRTTSPISPNNNSGNPRDRLSIKSVEDDPVEMDHLLQRLLSAEEEMKREQELLTALDRKQKLIEVQEQKIARLDAVNNQLLEALAQIRDSLQQQHVQAQQQKIQMQLHKQQQQLESLSNSMLPLTASPQSNRNAFSSGVGRNLQNINMHKYPQASTAFPSNVAFDYSQAHGQHHLGELPPPIVKRTKPSHNNTTKVMITSDSSSENSSPLMSLDDTCSYSSNAADEFCPNNNHSSRDSSTFLAENALKMLAELKSSSC